MKKLSVIILALLLGASMIAAAGCSADKNTDTDPDKDGNTSVTVDSSDKSSDAEDTPGYKELYLETVNELNTRYDDVEWTYGLVDVDGDGTPELVAGYPTKVSLYTYADNYVYTVIEEAGYGFAGNNGYYYLPGKNVIFNSDYDMAGAIVYETYCKIGEYHNLQNIHTKPLYTSLWEDANGDGLVDDSEIGETVHYFYGNDELTEAEYNELRFGDVSAFEILSGEMTYDEITAELKK